MSQPVTKDEGQDKKKQDFCHGFAVKAVRVVVNHEITCTGFIIMYMGGKGRYML